jgi:hypothetical protein
MRYIIIMAILLPLAVHSQRRERSLAENHFRIEKKEAGWEVLFFRKPGKQLLSTWLTEVEYFHLPETRPLDLPLRFLLRDINVFWVAGADTLSVVLVLSDDHKRVYPCINGLFLDSGNRLEEKYWKYHLLVCDIQELYLEEEEEYGEEDY